MVKKLSDTFPVILERILNTDSNDISEDQSFVVKLLESHQYKYEWIDKYTPQGKQHIRIWEDIDTDKDNGSAGSVFLMF